jgi:hypothetical protein
MYYLYDQQTHEFVHDVYGKEMEVFKTKEHVKKYLIKLHSIDHSTEEVNTMKTMTIEQLTDQFDWKIVRKSDYEQGYI